MSALWPDMPPNTTLLWMHPAIRGLLPEAVESGGMFRYTGGTWRERLIPTEPGSAAEVAAV